jgi:hypothetical protein
MSGTLPSSRFVRAFVALCTASVLLWSPPARAFYPSRSSECSAAAAPSVGYQYFRGENLLRSINQNVPTSVAAGSNNGCRPVSAYLNNSQYRGGRLVEAFNLTDRVNPITRNNTFGPGSYPLNPLPSFNTMTAVGDPRTIQFGMRFTF